MVQRHAAQFTIGDYKTSGSMSKHKKNLEWPTQEEWRKKASQNHQQMY